MKKKRQRLDFSEVILFILNYVVEVQETFEVKSFKQVVFDKLVLEFLFRLQTNIFSQQIIFYTYKNKKKFFIVLFWYF